MQYTILPNSATRRNTMPVPMKRNQFDYSFLNSVPTNSVVAIQVPNGRKAEYIRRSVQTHAKTTGSRKNHTMLLDNVLLVW